MLKRGDIVVFSVVLSFLIIPVLVLAFHKLFHYKTVKFGEDLANDYKTYSLLSFYIFPYSDLIAKLSIVEGLFYVYNNSSCGHFYNIPIWMVQNKSNYNKIDRCIPNPNTLNSNFYTILTNQIRKNFKKYLIQLERDVKNATANLEIKISNANASVPHTFNIMQGAYILTSALAFFTYVINWTYEGKYLKHEWTIPYNRLFNILSLISTFESNFTYTYNKIVKCWKHACWDFYSLSNRSENNTCRVSASYSYRCAQCREIKNEPECQPWFSKLFPEDYKKYLNLSEQRLKFVNKGYLSYNNSMCIKKTKLTVKYLYDCVFKGNKCGPYNITLNNYTVVLYNFTYDAFLRDSPFHLTGKTNFVYFVNFSYNCSLNNYFICQDGGGKRKNLYYNYYVCENGKCIKKEKILKCNLCCSGCSRCCRPCLHGGCCGWWTCEWGCNLSTRDCYCHCVCR